MTAQMTAKTRCLAQVAF